VERIECVEHRLRVCGAFGGRLGEAAHHQRGECGRRRRRRVRNRRRRLREVGGDPLLRRRPAGERMSAREHLVRHDAPRVHVRPSVDVVARCLLRRDVRRGADGGPDPRQRAAGRVTHAVGRPRPGRRQRLRDAEVRDHRRASREEHVLGLHVAVHDAPRVRVRQGARDVAQDGDRFGGRHRTRREPLPERRALDERHGVVRQPVGPRPRVQHGHHVRVLEPRRETDLAREPFGAQPLGQLGREHLHHDPAAERHVLRHEHAGHPAAPELALEGVRRTERRLKPVAEEVGHGAARRAVGDAGAPTYGPGRDRETPDAPTPAGRALRPRPGSTSSPATPPGATGLLPFRRAHARLTCAPASCTRSGAAGPRRRPSGASGPRCTTGSSPRANRRPVREEPLPRDAQPEIHRPSRWVRVGHSICRSVLLPLPCGDLRSDVPSSVPPPTSAAP
jgi:hypothetical protein